MQTQEKPQIIREFIARLAQRLWEQPNDDLLGIMLTGSFAAYLKNDKRHAPSWNAMPDVNFYPLVNGDEMSIIRVERSLMTSIEQTIKEFKEKGIKINTLLDLHPFSVSPHEFNAQSDAIQLQLTTRVINLGMPESYPPYCWHGWLANNILLHQKNPHILEGVKYRDVLVQDDEWYRNVYLALLSYGNVLQVLPLFTTKPGHLFDETFRYAKEITKDGFSVPLSKEEYANGKSFELLHGWKDFCTKFYDERYGGAASVIVSDFVEIDKDYLAKRKTVDPFLLIEKSYKLREIIFDKFKQKLVDHYKTSFLQAGQEIAVPAKGSNASRPPGPSKTFDHFPLWW